MGGRLEEHGRQLGWIRYLDVATNSQNQHMD